MYLAEHIIKGRKKYMLRDSLYDSDSCCWRSLDLYDLGWSPWEYIKYPGGNSFYIDEEIVEKLEEQGLDYNLSELEELFWPFIKKDIRQKLEPFYCRGLRIKSSRGENESQGEERIHVFDRRRLYYLRSGAVNQRRIERLPYKYFKDIRHKSRDEIEQYFLQLEKDLPPREYKQYVFVIFDLQSFFSGSSARFIPQALDQEDLDRNFIKVLCKLHGDGFFQAGFDHNKRFLEYLTRYAIMFFDYEFDGASAWEDYMQDFINSKRFHIPPNQRKNFTGSEVVEIFGVTEEEIKKITKSDLTRLYRKKAHELHPDKGGEHDAFVRLTEAYKELLRKKARQNNN